MTHFNHVKAITISTVCVLIVTTAVVAAEVPQISGQPMAVALTDDIFYLPNPLPVLAPLKPQAPIGDDVFGEAMDDTSLRAAAGGTADYAIDLAGLGVNSSSTLATISDNSLDNTTTGGVMDNLVSNNSGFTTVVFNSGNQVIFNNTVQVNVFAGSN